ncbi:MAG: DUF4215 domain-containing protein, partial [Patescibacteria group bacterium]
PILIASTGMCGDGQINMNEECDDANQRDLDGCSSMCFLEFGICGDGILQRALGEQCEPSLHDSTLPYACSYNCRFSSKYCGNGYIDPGEQCDEGPRNSDNPGALCRTNCSSARCSDSILDPYEGCDDGNLLNGDGCNSSCQIETGSAFETAFAFPQALNFQQGRGYPGIANLQSLPYGLPLAPISQATSRPPAGDTGPAAVLVMTGGAVLGWVLNRKKKKSAFAKATADKKG